MPYKSDQQRKWAHTDAGKKALGGDEAVHEWDEASKGKRLPKYAKSENLSKAALSVKIPRQKRMPGADAKPSVFFKNEQGAPKHPSVQKLSDFLASTKLKKCGQ